MSEKLKVVELFAGVGGFRVGLERSSREYFETVWADQWEPGSKSRQFAFRCYDGHFGESGSINVNEDINEVWQTVPDHNLLVGGFPCQDYSVASTKAKGIEGKKGVLWWNIHDIIKLRHPEYVLLENVDRLLKSPVKQRGRDFAIILRCFADEGYYVEWRVINASEYGFQQRRRRIFIFAYRKDTPFAKQVSRKKKDTVAAKSGFFAKAFPVKDVSENSKRGEIDISREKYADLVEISDRYKSSIFNAGFLRGYSAFTFQSEPDYNGDKVTLGDLLVSDAEPEFYVDDESLEKWKAMKGRKKILRKHKDGTHYYYSEGAIPFPDVLERAGRTMLTSEGSANRSSHLILDPVEDRYRTLTPIECERLNGFPDDWTAGYMTSKQRYFCMGNALVVQLIKVMGDRIQEITRSL